jgi:hypothetical protein
MKINVNGIEHEVNISIGERNLLIMSDASIEGIESLLGKSAAELGAIGAAFGQAAPVIKRFKGVTYEFLTQAAGEAALESENAELKSVALALEALIPAPVPGEAWDAAKWYRTGDTVQGYECIKTCKGRTPSESPLYWAAMAQEEPQAAIVWADIESGATIEAGAVVEHADKLYRCIREHKKSIIRTVTNTDFWEQVDGAYA